MNAAKTIPVKITPQMYKKLKRAAEKIGWSNKPLIITMCLKLFLEYLEEHNYQIPKGMDLSEALAPLDDRTERKKMNRKGRKK